MRVYQLIEKILQEVKGDGFLEVRIDASIPKDFDYEFKIEANKGFLLLVPREKSARGTSDLG